METGSSIFNDAVEADILLTGMGKRYYVADMNKNVPYSSDGDMLPCNGE